MNLYATLEPLIAGAIVLACTGFVLRKPISRLLGRKSSAACGSCDHCEDCGQAKPLSFHPKPDAERT
jgi:hypothetical protein